jgi:hypothetical protein
MRIPPQDVLDPEAYQDWIVGSETPGEGSIIPDENGNFTTATALTALQVAGAGMAEERTEDAARV